MTARPSPTICSARRFSRLKRSEATSARERVHPRADIGAQVVHLLVHPAKIAPHVAEKSEGKVFGFGHQDVSRKDRPARRQALHRTKPREHHPPAGACSSIRQLSRRKNGLGWFPSWNWPNSVSLAIRVGERVGTRGLIGASALALMAAVGSDSGQSFTIPTACTDAGAMRRLLPQRWRGGADGG